MKTAQIREQNMKMAKTFWSASKTSVRLCFVSLFLAIIACGVGFPAAYGEDGQTVNCVMLASKTSSHICTQMVLPLEKQVQARITDIQLNRENIEEPLTSIKAVIPSLGLINSKWPNGTKLRVRLFGGSEFIRSKVREVAIRWNQFSGVKFQFVNDGPAEVRVSFVSNNMSYSYVGTDCLSLPANQTTMNFGWFTRTTEEAEFSRVVLHEFGHALGLVHEHQSPVGGIPWDKPKVYAYYKLRDGWSKENVDQNVFHLYEREKVQFSKFDRNSIMLYAIPSELTTNGYSVGWNNVLSDTDKEFISWIYPSSFDNFDRTRHLILP